MLLEGIQHNAEWRGQDDLLSYVLQLQDSEKVSTNFIVRLFSMTTKLGQKNQRPKF